MKVTAKTKTKEVRIQGVDFVIPQPYTKGHQVTENEANALNQLTAENVRNNFASTVKKAKEAAAAPGGKPIELSALQGALDEYIKSYEIGIRRAGGGTTANPVAQEAMQIARELVKKQWNKAGNALKDLDGKDLTRMAKELLEKHPQVREHARGIVRQREEAAEALGIG